MAHTSENTKGFKAVDAKELSDRKSGKKVDYTCLGYMSWELVTDKGEAILRADGKPMLASENDIRLSLPEDPTHDYYCQSLVDLAELTKKQGNRATYYLKVELKTPVPKAQPDERPSMDELFAALGDIRTT